MFVVLNDILIFHEGVIDFVFVGKTKEQDKAIRALKPGDKFKFMGETYEVDYTAPLLEEENYYSHTVVVRL
jgi:tRNA(Ile2) C34 agmatinyltransferase TiaS